MRGRENPYSRTKNLLLAAEIADSAITNVKVAAGAGIALTKMATDLSNVMLGLGAGYRVARGSVVVTGVEVVATGLTTIVAAVAIPRADLVATDMWVSCEWAGANLTLKLWKPTVATPAANVTPIAADGGLQVDWIAIGT